MGIPIAASSPLRGWTGASELAVWPFWQAFRKSKLTTESIIVTVAVDFAMFGRQRSQTEAESQVINVTLEDPGRLGGCVVRNGTLFSGMLACTWHTFQGCM